MCVLSILLCKGGSIDMGKDYYIFTNGQIKRRENTIHFTDGDDLSRDIPIEIIERLHLFGEISLNTKFFNFISKYGVIVNFYNYYGFYSGSYYPRKKNVSGYLITRQADFYNNKEKRLYIAKCFIDSAAHHILRNLRRYKPRTEKIMDKIENERINILTANSIDELMGAEGRMRNAYYSAYNYILKNGFTFEKREKRPPTDPLNALISFGNSMMYTTVLGEIYKTQLDPTISFLHEPSTKRFSLCLDISEIFKPLIVDPLIFYLINNKMLKLDDFDTHESICFLNEKGRNL
jgi:CRISP-associated protein Cas1